MQTKWIDIYLEYKKKIDEEIPFSHNERLVNLLADMYPTLKDEIVCMEKGSRQLRQFGDSPVVDDKKAVRVILSFKYGILLKGEVWVDAYDEENKFIGVRKHIRLNDRVTTKREKNINNFSKEGPSDQT